MKTSPGRGVPGIIYIYHAVARRHSPGINIAFSSNEKEEPKGDGERGRTGQKAISMEIREAGDGCHDNDLGKVFFRRGVGDKERRVVVYRGERLRCPVSLPGYPPDSVSVNGAHGIR